MARILLTEYTISYAVDNSAVVYINGFEKSSLLGELSSNYSTGKTFTQYFQAGYHEITMICTNVSGPFAGALVIFKNGQYFDFIDCAPAFTTSPITESRSNDSLSNPLFNELVILPNPASDIVNILFKTSSQDDQDLFINVYNTSGELVKKMTIVRTVNVGSLPIPIDELSPGVYLFIIDYQGKRQVEKIIVIR